MALNDHTVRAQGTDVYPGVANPTASSISGDPMANNFADDPTNPDRGAGAGPDFSGDKDARKAMRNAAGVVEAHPGIIENTHIDPLSETSNKDDGWANATVNPGQSKASTAAKGASEAVNAATEVSTGAAKLAYGKVTGNTTYVEEGKQAVYGKTT